MLVRPARYVAELDDAFGSGRFNQVPVLNGTTHDEGRLFIQVASPDGKPISPVLYWGGTGLAVGLINTGPTLARYPYRQYGTPDLRFTCNADRRGRVFDVDIDRMSYYGRWR